MSEIRKEVLRWVDTVTESLEASDREGAEAYRDLDGDERWKRVAAACHRVTDRLSDEQREQIEHEAQADSERFGRLMREIRARLER